MTVSQYDHFKEFYSRDYECAKKWSKIRYQTLNGCRNTSIIINCCYINI